MDLATLFDNLTLERIEALIAQGQEEDLTLDFKTINRSDLSHSDDKKSLAKGLSGFANSSGGMIIWGIDARRNSAGVDCACGRKEIEQLSLFVNRLNEFTGSAATPIVDGVRHRTFPSSGDQGFAATLVPESDSGPHMAKFSEDRYYKRSGGSFYRMEHFDLEDMFGRRKRPHLILQLTPIKSNLDGRHRVVLSVANTGRGIGRAPFLAFNIPPGFHRYAYGVDGNRNEGLPKLSSTEQGYLQYGGGMEVAIHPGTSRDICALERSTEFSPTEASIEYQVAAEGVQLRASTATIDFNS